MGNVVKPQSIEAEGFSSVAEVKSTVRDQISRVYKSSETSLDFPFIKKWQKSLAAASQK